MINLPLPASTTLLCKQKASQKIPFSQTFSRVNFIYRAKSLQKSANALKLCYFSIFSITDLFDIYLRHPGELPADVALHPAHPSYKSAVFKGRRELKSPGQTACLSQAITFRLLTPVRSPITCVGIQASGLELVIAVALGTES